MGERKRTVLIPRYLKNFKCIGTACEDSCCIGWRVDIDEKTYKKYQKVKDEELIPLLDKNVTRNRAANHGEKNYAKVKLLNNSKCPFLNEKMLCKIQLNIGEGYLSEVCTTYPRISNKINGRMERTATMSCPEAVRFALLNKDIMEFDEIEEEYSVKNFVKMNIDTKDIKMGNKSMKYLWELRIFTITLLQDRRYSLGERLIILGMFFQKLQQNIEDNSIYDITKLIGIYTNHLEEGIFREGLSNIPVQHNIQMELLKEIADKRFFMGINNSRYMECFAEFINGIQYSSDEKVEEIGQRYQDACKNIYEPFINEHEYILENYLVNHVFKNLFPFTGEKHVFDAYMMLVLHYALIKMHLIGMSAFHKELNVELVIKLIQSFAKTVEHNQIYLHKIDCLMRESGFNTMAYMAILIKN